MTKGQRTKRFLQTELEDIQSVLKEMPNPDDGSMTIYNLLYYIFSY